MGAWSAGISGNDTAMDLRTAYSEAFATWDVETALRKIDQYVRSEGFRESDPEEWCDYSYSLADYMWKKGILTEEVKNTALRMIDSEFGLECWAESGKALLNKRKKTLAEFRKKLLSPQPPKKKLKINLYMSPIFETGDVIAFQLKTADQCYVAEKSRFSEEFFRACHDKWAVMRKVCDTVSYRSKIVPGVQDIWPNFQLYGKIFDDCPALEQLRDVPWAQAAHNGKGVFFTEGNMRYFNKRNARVIGRNLVNIEEAVAVNALNDLISFGVRSAIFPNAETKIINAILGGKKKFYRAITLA